MVSHTVLCPHCDSGERVRKHGVRGGKARYFCASCARAFTLHPTPRGVPAEKQRLILNALKEGISYSAITRTFNCSFSTVYALLKKP